MTSAITFGGITVQPGEMVKQYIDVPGENAKLPVAIFNGAKDGKKFLVTASIHGFEFPGIEASCQLIRELDPKEMSGVIIIIPVVNASGFYGRQPYVCPQDEERKNLNKLAPGKADGTFGERLVYYLEQEFIMKMDFHLDLHSGDATEQLSRFAAAGNAQDEETRKFIHNIINHTSFDYYTQSTGKCEFYNGSVYFNNIPSMMFECGGAGRWTEEEVEFEKENIKRIAQTLGILPGEAPLNTKQVWLKNQAWEECGADGLFYPFCELGDEIKEGQKLYEIRDVWGNILDEHYAKYDGKVFILNNTLGVSKGDDSIFYANAGC